MESYQRHAIKGSEARFATLEKLQILDTVSSSNLQTVSKLTLLSIQVLHKLLGSIP